jgi:hypothetical protein
MIEQERRDGVSRDGATLHLKCAPKLAEERAHRKAGKHLDAFFPVSGVDDLFDELTRRGARITEPLPRRRASGDLEHPMRDLPPHPPVRVMMLDERFRGSNDVARERDPVEMYDEHVSVAAQQPRGLCCRFGAIEPVPALPGRDDVERMTGQAGGLGMSDTMSGPTSELSVESGRRKRRQPD